MAIPLGFLITHLGMRAVPVFLRSGKVAMRYILASTKLPGTTKIKERITTDLAKKVLKGNYVDDVVKLRTRSKANEVAEILDPKILATSQKEQLMHTTYRDMSKLMQRKTSYSHETKIAGDIQKGFGQSFSKEASGRLFLAGDRATVATKETLKKVTEAPKDLLKPGTLKKVPDIKKGPDLIKAEKLAAEKAALETAKGKLATGTIARKDILPLTKEARKQVFRLHKVKKKLKTAATGTETGPVITEGLRGVGSAPKPAWWQAMVPKVLRVGGYKGPGYTGAYPAGISGPRVGTLTGGLLFAGTMIHPFAEHITKKHLAKEDILSVEQIMNAAGDTYGEAYNPNVMIDKLESGDVILPERIE